MRTTSAGWLAIVMMVLPVVSAEAAEDMGVPALRGKLEAIRGMDGKRLLEFTANYKGLVERADFKAGPDGQAALVSCRMVAVSLLEVVEEKTLAADDARTVAIAEVVRRFLEKTEAEMPGGLDRLREKLSVLPPSGVPNETGRVFPNAVEQAQMRGAHEWKIQEQRVWADLRGQQEELERSWGMVLTRVMALPLPRETMVALFTTEKGWNRKALGKMLDRRERMEERRRRGSFR